MELPETSVQWGVTGVLLSIVVAVVYALLRGKLVPRSVLEDVRRDRDDRLKEQLEVIASWKDTVRTRDEIIEEIIPAMREILDLSKTNMALISALKLAVAQKVGGQDA
jgi:hypothetical protein